MKRKPIPITMTEPLWLRLDNEHKRVTEAAQMPISLAALCRALIVEALSARDAKRAK